MGIAGTLLIYAVMGLVVASAIALKEAPSGPFSFALSALCWPLFAPTLLAGSSTDRKSDSAVSAMGTSHLDPCLRHAEDRLLRAMRELGPVWGGVLAPEMGRIHQLVDGLSELARRQLEMDAILSTPEFNADEARRLLSDLAKRGCEEADERVASLRARLRNIDRLSTLRNHAQDNLERAIFKLEEMSSQVSLLRFAGTTETEAVERMRQIAETVDSISESLIAAA